MQLTRWLLLFGLIGFFASSVFGQAPAAQPQAIGAVNVGKIIAKGVRGTVTAKSKEANAVPVVVVSEMQLSQGQEITVGAASSCVLVFTNGASINLAADSVLDIERFVQDPYTLPANTNFAALTDEPSKSTTRLRLSKGELVGQVKKLDQAGGSTFTVATPVGAAGIRGTVFRIVYRPTGTGNAFAFQMTTQEGSVEVTLSGTAAAAAPLTVNQSQEVIVTADVTTNAAGQTVITILPPAGAAPGTAPQTITVQTATTETLTAISETTATVIATAIINTVLPPSTPTPDPTPAGTPAPQAPPAETPPPTPPAPEPPVNPSPGLTPQPNTLTPGAGAP